jgi:hypothetical protein
MAVQFTDNSAHVKAVLNEAAIAYLGTTCFNGNLFV